MRTVLLRTEDFETLNRLVDKAGGSMINVAGFYRAAFSTDKFAEKFLRLAAIHPNISIRDPNWVPRKTESELAFDQYWDTISENVGSDQEADLRRHSLQVWLAAWEAGFTSNRGPIG